MFAFSDTPLLSKQTYAGEPVQIECAGTKPVNDGVDWLYQQQPGARAYHIISAGYLTNGVRGGRLGISGSTLIINNVNPSDQGVYICIEHGRLGPQHRTNLTVIGKYTTRVKNDLRIGNQSHYTGVFSNNKSSYSFKPFGFAKQAAWLYVLPMLFPAFFLMVDSGPNYFRM